jgi:hypothetical protein
VTFSNHPGATKSYDSVKEKKYQLQQLGFIEAKEEISVDYQGATLVEMHDGSRLALTKVDDQTFDVTDSLEALRVLHQARRNQQFVTGLFYFNKDQKNLVQEQKMGSKPLSELSEVELRPSRQQLEQIQDFYA